MLDFFKTATGSLNYMLIVSLCGWVVSTVGVFSGLHKHRTDTISAVRDREAAEKQKKDEERRRIAAETRLAAAEKEIEKLQPKPLPERLRAILERIDPKILPALREGRTGFEGGITASQYHSLQTLASETDAKSLIQISPDVKMGVGMGPEGMTYGVTFTLTDAVLR